MTESNLENLPRSRKEAKALGVKRFFTGVPCKHGHVAVRYVSSPNCSECIAIENAKWCRDDKDRRNSQRRQRPADQKDAIRLQKKAGRDANREHVRETDRIRGRRHKEKGLERALQWQRDNPDKVRARAGRRRARVADAGTYTAEDVQALFKAQDGKCAYCKIDVSENYHVDHIMPLARGGMNTRNNIQLCCPACNWSKADRDPVEFAQSLGMLV